MSEHDTRTLAEVAELFRCSGRKISAVARANGIGMQLGGRSGWRFTDADMSALREALRPAPPVAVRRRRRRAA